MTREEAVALVRTILDRVYDGGSPIGPGNVFDDVAWGYVGEGAPAVMSIFEDGLLRVTAGAVVKVPGPWAPDLFRAVSKINEGLHFGRAWADAHADGSGMYVLLQELVPVSLLSVEHQPSIEYLMELVRGLPVIAARSAEEIMAACGGEPWTDLTVLAMSG